MKIEGEIFQPWPRSARHARAGAFGRHAAGLPFSPVKFSGLIERDLALGEAREIAQVHAQA